MTSTSHGDERRAEPRKLVVGRWIHWRLSSGHAPVGAQLVNISRSGLGLIIDGRDTPDRDTLIQVLNLGPRLIVNCRIVRLQRRPDGRVLLGCKRANLLGDTRWARSLRGRLRELLPGRQPVVAMGA